MSSSLRTRAGLVVAAVGLAAVGGVVVTGLSVPAAGHGHESGVAHSRSWVTASSPDDSSWPYDGVAPAPAQ